MIVIPQPVITAPIPVPPWAAELFRLRGLHELPGTADNPWIVEALKRCGLPSNMLHDETAWCSAGLNRIFEDVGMHGTKSAAALSWASYGIALDTPARYCIQVFDREGGHHVNIHLVDVGDQVISIGCNQSNAITVDVRPVAKRIALRWPA